MSTSIIQSQSNGPKHLSTSLGDSVSQLGNFLQQGASKWEVVPIASTGWNAHQFHKTWKKLTQERIRQERADREDAMFPIVPLLIDEPGLREYVDRRRQRERRAITESLKRCYLRFPAYGIRILKISTLFIPYLQMRKGVEGVFDTAAHSLMLKHHITTKNPIHLLYPENISPKDTAFRILKITTSTFGLIGGLFTIAVACEYIDKDDPYYQTAKQAAVASLISDISYGFLQFFDLVAPRE